MINKQSLWFVTLFSLIIVLSIYYFSTDQTNLMTSKYHSSSSVVAKTTDEDNISVLKVSDDEATLGEIDELENILLDDEATLEEKNDAYDKLEVIKSDRSKEEEITRLIKNEYNYANFVKIHNNEVNVVISSDVHNTEIASNIIKTIQSKFKDNKYITVRFEG